MELDDKTNLTIETVQKIANAFVVGVDDLMR